MLNLARVPSILLLGVVYVVYVLIGGVVFWKLEGDLEQQDIIRVQGKKQMLLVMYPCLNQEGLEAVAQVRHKKKGKHVRGDIPASILCKYLLVSFYLLLNGDISP